MRKREMLQESNVKSICPTGTTKINAALRVVTSLLYVRAFYVFFAVTVDKKPYTAFFSIIPPVNYYSEIPS